MKITKYEMNKVLNHISNDNKLYGLILKIAYLYARSIGELVDIKKQDINFTENTITLHLFNNDIATYPLYEGIKEDLQFFCEDKKENENIFTQTIPRDKIMPNLNEYLFNNNFLKGAVLTTQDFRLLRGQHLYNDGVDLKTIKELYRHRSIESTKKFIEYKTFTNELNGSMETLFDEYTNLNLYKNNDYDKYDNYYCSYDDEEAFIEVFDKHVMITGDKNIKNKLTNQKNLLSLLDKLKKTGEYSLINKITVMKT